jgi:O-antigen ligase
MYKILRLAEYGFTVFALLFYTGGPLPVILSGGRSEGLLTTQPDYTLMNLCWVAIYIITVFYLAPHWKTAAYLLVKDKWILLLTIIIFLSSSWSVNIDLTVARSIAVLGTTLFGVYFATRYSLKQQLYLLGWVFGLAIILSIFFVVALPQYGIMQGIHAGAWRGIYTHKNGFGAIMELSVITFLIFIISNRDKNWFFYTGILVSTILLLLSRSSSPLIYLIVLMLAFIISQVFRWEYRSRLVALSLFTTLGFVLVIWSVDQAEKIASIFGKDLTLTGRTELWGPVWEFIQKKPWLGYGYGAVWSGWNSETGLIWRIVRWEAPNAHNGFLEIWLGLGVLGLSVFAIHIAISFMKALTLINQTGGAVYFFPFLLILLTLINNVTESSLIDRNSIYWVLYVSATLSLQLKSNIIENTKSRHLSQI